MSYYNDPYSTQFPLPTKKQVLTALGVGAMVSAGAFLAMRYRVCRPNEFMVRTGLGIENMHVSKHGIIWPFQQVKMIDMTPKTFSFSLHNMSSEKVEFELPVSFSVAPVSPLADNASFLRYAAKMSNMDEKSFSETVLGVIEGETRGLTARLTIEEMFGSKEVFRNTVVKAIDDDLISGFGLGVVNANIKEMKDCKGNEYFEYRKQRAIQTANYGAQVDVARAKKDGDTGKMEQDRETRIKISSMEREAKLKENEQQAEIARSNALLKQIQEQARLSEQVATITTNNETLQREEEMKKLVEVKRAERELEKRRADDLNQSKISTERKIVEAEGEAQYIRQIADAKFYEAKTEADGALYRAEAEAKGILAVLNAKAQGLSQISNSSNSELATFYLGLEKDLPQTVSKYQADAVRGMEPKITVWNTGSDADQEELLLPIVRMVQSFSPLMNGIGATPSTTKS